MTQTVGNTASAPGACRLGLGIRHRIEGPFFFFLSFLSSSTVLFGVFFFFHYDVLGELPEAEALAEGRGVGSSFSFAQVGDMYL